jgi:hypothetical protein
MYLPKKANSEKLVLGIHNPCRIVFFFEFADEQLLGEGKWPISLESWSLQLRSDTKMLPQLKTFFFIVTSIVYGCNAIPKTVPLFSPADPVGHKFRDLLIDGYKLYLTLGATVLLIE